MRQYLTDEVRNSATVILVWGLDIEKLSHRHTRMPSVVYEQYNISLKILRFCIPYHPTGSAQHSW